MLQLSTQYNRISKHTHLKVRFLSLEGESTLDEEVLSIEAWEIRLAAELT
jgi:hypothetical protein